MIPLRSPLRWLSLVVLVGVACGPAAEAQKPKDLQWSHAFDLAVRKLGEADFTKETQKFGVEAFRDTNTGLELFLSQTGSLATAPGSGTVGGEAKGPAWLTGLDLPVRKAGQKEFDKQTTVHSLEVFRDPNADAWIFVTAKGMLAASAATTKPSAGGKAPQWVHSVDLSARKGGVKDWKEAAKYGIEVYRDGNTGDLIYICETGSLAAIPAAAEIKGMGKAPEWLHGLDLSCRKASEPNFSKETRRIGVEVYRDLTTGNLLLMSETGSLAVMPAPANVKAPTPNVKEPRWTHGLNMKVRAFGEKEFSEKTKVIGAEVFRDENVNALVYVDELGNISAAPAK